MGNYVEDTFLINAQPVNKRAYMVFPVKSCTHPHCEGNSSEDSTQKEKNTKFIQLLHRNSILLRPQDPKLIQKVVTYPVQIEYALKLSEFGKYFTQLSMVES